MYNFLSKLKLPTLTNIQNENLLQPITTKEFHLAIAKLKVDKTLGSDGYTAEWYKNLKEELLPILLKTFNWIMQIQLPPSWKEAVISIIAKEGKDRTECSSYRLISVLNLDYKLLTMLPDILDLDQCGFIQQRQTVDNIRRSLHVMDQINRWGAGSVGRTGC